MVLLARTPGFPWTRFFDVARWAFLAYAVIAGMIEYAFLRNHLSGGPLIILTLSLVVFAVHVPMLIGFTVARYDEGDASGAGRRRRLAAPARRRLRNRPSGRRMEGLPLGWGPRL